MQSRRNRVRPAQFPSTLFAPPIDHSNCKPSTNASACTRFANASAIVILRLSDRLDRTILACALAGSECVPSATLQKPLAAGNWNFIESKSGDEDVHEASSSDVVGRSQLCPLFPLG